MLHLFAWTAVVGLAVLWSLACWALGSFGIWALSNADQLSGVAAGIGQGPVPSWLLPWLAEGFAEAVKPLLVETAAQFASLLQSIPGLSGGFSVLVWVVWALGTGLLLVLGITSSLAVRWWQRRAHHKAAEPPGTELPH